MPTKNEKPSMTAALVCASEFNAQAFQIMNDAGKFDFVVAVDGGYQHLRNLETTPDVAIGDFDSLGFEPAGLRAIKFPKDKDETDLELALKELLERNFEKAIVFGSLGKRLDHTLTSLRACAFANKKGLNVEMVGSAERVVFLTGEDAWQSDEIEKGTTISLVPQLGKIDGLFLRGLKWEADDLKLDEFATIGQSNVATGEPILIGLERGTIAIIINCA